MMRTIVNGAQSLSGAPLNLKSAQLQGGVLRFADLSAADLEGADLSGAELQHVCFNNANLRAANLSGATLDHANLGAANLKKARPTGASLHLANLEAADLEGADLTGADLLHARLNEANLRDANLTSARLDHADFAGADLKGANLSGASLHHAKNLTRTQLKAARRSQSTILPSYLQGSTSQSAESKKAGRRPSIAPARKAEGFGVPRLAFSERPAWVIGAAVAALIVVGMAWRDRGPLIRLASSVAEGGFGQLLREVSLAELSALPTNLTARKASVSRLTSPRASQLIAALAETELREPTLPTLQAGAIPVLPTEDFVPNLSSISSAEVEVLKPNAIAFSVAPPDTLHPVTKIRTMCAREVAQVPIDTNEERTLRKLGHGATVIASYYGKEFAGRRTASGETFSPGAMTAAHRTLPFGTRFESHIPAMAGRL